MKNYLFKIEPQVYNYSKLINYYQKANENKFLEKIYTTNNILESINSKINLYLPKRATTNFFFVKSLSNVIINDELRIKKIIRKDLKTKAILQIIKELDFNNNLK